MSKTQKKYKKGDFIKTKIKSWSLDKTSNGQKYVRITFYGGISKTLWASSKVFANPVSAKIFWDTLSAMGFKGKSLKMLATEGALNIEREFNVQVDSTRQYEGRTFYDAGFVNAIYEAGFKDSNMTADELDEFDISSEGYVEDAQDIPMRKKEPSEFENDVNQTPEYNVANDTNFAADDIPF